VRLGVLLGILAVATVLGAAAMVWRRDAQFFLGLLAGSSLTILMMVELGAPEHVDRWRRGAEAERRTMRELGHLRRHGWAIANDLADGVRSNRDHIAVAPSGDVFLLDTKAPGGTIEVTAGVLRVRWLEDPEDGYERDLTPGLKAAAARLANDLAAPLGRRPWVTPVVVIWGRWAGKPHIHDGVAWVPGSSLEDRMLAHGGIPDRAKHHAAVKAVLTLASS
jgi:hypothetical protein